MSFAPVPPPIRRIDPDAPATIARPGSNGVAGAAAAIQEAVAERPGTKGERMRINDLSIAYGTKLAVREVTLPVREHEVLALIGPSGCGKTTLLRSLNRLTELTATAVSTGEILLDGQSTHELEATDLRRRVSMVFQQPNPFPMSIFDNVAFAIREQASRKPGKSVLQPQVRDALERAGLWDEVGDNLDHPALRLSGGQQQRLCIARALAAKPEVLLLDEPCSALDPKSTEIIEDLIVKLKEQVAIVIVTHNLQQAQRVSDYVAFMYLGDLVEYGPVDQVFNAPLAERTKNYVAGTFG